MDKPDLVVSFSGGKTSAYMSYILKRDYSDKYNLRFVFANTGEEHENTLGFVDSVDREFGLGVVWVEAVVHERGKGNTHKVVDFKSASRNGEPFRAVIAKYGIPNKTHFYCTRALKTEPIQSWIKESGLAGADMALGIRADESSRRSSEPERYNIVYPLMDWFLTDKIDVNNFWESQPFNLEIMEYQGNCKTCYKKSDRKLFMIAKENPEWFDFNREMENDHGHVAQKEDFARVFFRQHRSTDQLLAQADEYNKNAGAQRSIFDLDENGGCSESCEAY